MKIIQVTPRYYPYIGGIESHVQMVSETLVKRGFEVEVISTDPSGNLPYHEIINGVTLTRFKSFAPGDAYYLAPQIYFYLKKRKCDIIHAHSYNTFPSLFTALSKKNRAFIFTPHTFGFSLSFPRNIFHKIYKSFGRLIFDSADKVISITKVEEEWLKKTFGLDKKKLQYIPLPIELFDANLEKKRKNDVKIAFIGRLSSEKNVDVLISAFEIVKRTHPECKLYIIGDGPLKRNLEGISSNINNIYFPGRLDHKNVIQFLDDTDIFVLAYRFEVSPVSVLEAMTRSVPVIVTRVGELPYILENGRSCLFTKVGDINDLATKILTLVEDEDFAKRIGDSGLKFVEEKHDIKKIIDKYISLYQEVLTGKEINV